ncbi:DMT family transporter [Methanomethylophilus alvi]|jgi:multidrug transporter EmrE-like cation transporter|uniref:DMT family transporter n=2 Tax=Methanomethylophilus alvi TaxID=1291540 RepID=UPI000338BF28|nr:SMR family transporter [Methanomethylophilus alvi]MDD7480400.1 SMR family transporter [Methanomethylophilus alvi]MDY7060591.1 SMR family transporter [Methanomethylophilus alvi]CDF30140.1 small multidrug resistance protein [Methanoculleus sp. CAG:1088]
MSGLLFLIAGGLLEPVWVIAMTKAGGNTDRRAFWYVVFLSAMFMSLMFMSRGMKTMSVGISYAIWTAVGALSTIVAGRILYHEGISWKKVAAVTLILIGISGLEAAG